MAKTPSPRRVIFAVIAVVLLTCVFGVAPSMRHDLLYHESQMTAAAVDALSKSSGWQLDTVRGEVTHVGLVRPATDASQPWVLFFAGNDMSLEDSVNLLTKFAGDAGWGMAVYAYRGYDGSGGIPSEKALVADARAVATHLMTSRGVSANKLVVVGYSLGSGVASQLVAGLCRAHTPPAGLMLAAAYTSIPQIFNDHTAPVLTGWLAPDVYNSGEAAADISVPVLLVHGDHDSVIDSKHSRELGRILGKHARLVILADGRHNNVFFAPDTRAAFIEFIQRL